MAYESVDQLQTPESSLKPIQAAFLASYTGEKKKNQFTKVQMLIRLIRYYNYIFTRIYPV